MDDVNLDDDMERHWRMVFKDNDGGVEENFVGFPAMNLGRTFVVSFQILRSVLGVRGCGRRKII